MFLQTPQYKTRINFLLTTSPRQDKMDFNDSALTKYIFGDGIAHFTRLNKTRQARGRSFIPPKIREKK